MNLKNTTNLVLLCYGNKVELRRSVLCILSFFAWRTAECFNFRVVCFTDDPDYLKSQLIGLDVEYVLLTEQSLSIMAGEDNYIHRRKICVLKETYALYPKDNILFLDSDTFFYGNSTEYLSELKEGTSIMHEREYRLEEAPEIFRLYMNHRLPNAPQYPLSFLSFIADRKFSLIGELVTFNEKQYVWNAGVIGIHNASLPLIEDVLTFSDEIFSKTKWFLSEQIAFCLLLQAKTILRPAAKSINHYHRNKDVMDALIVDLLQRKTACDSLANRLSMVKRFTFEANKLVAFDLACSIVFGEMKNRRYINGARIMFKGFADVPINRGLFLLLRRKTLKFKL